MNNKIIYHKVGDYYLPNLYLAKDEYEKDYQIGKYGHLRLDYLRTNKKAEYTIMLMDNTLRKHILDTGKQAKERFETLMAQMLEKNPIDENSKNIDPLKWVGLMNNYKHTAEEILFSELIHI
ncbi:MAG: TnpV protein [Clostridia bacterium]|nr:TnpV protein [Clostridia bacterium]